MKKMLGILIIIFIFYVIWTIEEPSFYRRYNKGVNIGVEILTNNMEMLIERSQLEYFSYENGEKAICVYEGTYDSEVIGSKFAVYKETLMKDIVFVNMLVIEADTYNIYTWNEDCLTHIGVIEIEELELSEISEYEDDSELLFVNISEIELLDYVIDVLAQNGFNNLKLIYDGDSEFINRKYYVVSSFSDFEDHIIREETFYIDMENGNIYQTSENNDYLRTELHYIGGF